MLCIYTSKKPALDAVTMVSKLQDLIFQTSVVRIPIYYHSRKMYRCPVVSPGLIPSGVSMSMVLANPGTYRRG